LRAPIIIRPAVLLATSQAIIKSFCGSSHSVRMLIDPGSELTFVSRQLVKQLQISQRHASIPIIGIGGSHSERTRGSVSITLNSIHSSQSINITAYLTKLTSSLPSFAVAEHSWPHLQGLQLADPDFLTPCHIDMILGADSYRLLIESDIIKVGVRAYRSTYYIRLDRSWPNLSIYYLGQPFSSSLSGLRFPRSAHQILDSRRDSLINHQSALPGRIGVRGSFHDHSYTRQLWALHRTAPTQIFSESTR
jgi:hypothetical protein